MYYLRPSIHLFVRTNSSPSSPSPPPLSPDLFQLLQLIHLSHLIHPIHPIRLIHPNRFEKHQVRENLKMNNLVFHDFTYYARKRVALEKITQFISNDHSGPGIQCAWKNAEFVAIFCFLTLFCRNFRYLLPFAAIY